MPQPELQQSVPPQPAAGQAWPQPGVAASLRVPVVCAPMTAVSGPELVAAACQSGIMGVLPRHNAASLDEFGEWLDQIRVSLRKATAEMGSVAPGPLAVNFATSRPPAALRDELRLCAEYGVEYIVSAMGAPGELARMAHDYGAALFHDVTTLRHAARAAADGVDGLVCIVAGGGGHSGLLSPLAFLPEVRRNFAGTILAAGGIATGAGVRAARTLGADLAYLGTRFIASTESRGAPAYKDMLVAAAPTDLVYTASVTAVPANWLRPSLRAAGLDPDTLPVSAGRGDYAHLPPGIRPWHDIWSAGQSVALIDDVPDVAVLVDRLAREYLEAA